ncbi:MAG: TraR/DksA C4-type zinc finger protein [Owenweeksia sp.]|nr:TraR/DksA C4-type zinc finger protein [Owenweeksia sp.]
MEGNEKEELRELIREKIAKMEKDTAELEELTKPSRPENAIGRVSRMDAINNRSVNEAALRQAKTKLTALRNSLYNIDKPDFGKCVRCGQTIPTGRLLLVPESGKCVNCSQR